MSFQCVEQQEKCNNPADRLRVRGRRFSSWRTEREQLDELSNRLPPISENCCPTTSHQMGKGDWRWPQGTALYCLLLVECNGSKSFFLANYLLPNKAIKFLGFFGFPFIALLQTFSQLFTNLTSTKCMYTPKALSFTFNLYLKVWHLQSFQPSTRKTVK